MCEDSSKAEKNNKQIHLGLILSKIDLLDETFISINIKLISSVFLFCSVSQNMVRATAASAPTPSRVVLAASNENET